MPYTDYLKEANLIAGKWVGADSKKTIDVINPSSGEKVGTVPKCGTAETQRAIDAASAAFPAYASMDLLERVGLLWKLHDAIIDNQQSLAELLTICLLYTSPSPRDLSTSRMPSSA